MDRRKAWKALRAPVFETLRRYHIQMRELRATLASDPAIFERARTNIRNTAYRSQIDKLSAMRTAEREGQCPIMWKLSQP